MLGALAVALTLAMPAPAEASLLRDACVDTGLQKVALEQVARQNRWRSARVSSNTNGSEWTVAYRAGDALIVLMGAPRDVEPLSGHGMMCSITYERAPSGLRTEIEGIAEELGLEGEPGVAVVPNGPDLMVWSAFGGMTLSYQAGSGRDSRASVSLSRQIVVSETVD